MASGACYRHVGWGLCSRVDLPATLTFTLAHLVLVTGPTNPGAACVGFSWTFGHDEPTNPSTPKCDGEAVDPQEFMIVSCLHNADDCSSGRPPPLLLWTPIPATSPLQSSPH